jgi:hypothetical protein|tara:strand:- start:581 stop:970 length:390 start_codon:yes stop_codon:yes gene_type:complete
MPFVKGQSGNPMGRPKGSIDNDTRQIRQAYQMLVEDNLDNLTDWLSQLGKESPEKAFNLMLKMSEYFLPKLSRKEVSADVNVFDNIKFQFGEGEAQKVVVDYLNQMDSHEAISVIDKALEKIESNDNND